MSIFDQFPQNPRAGKITLASVVCTAVVLSTTFFAYFEVGSPFNLGWAWADTATTTVTVLNTPPVWTVGAEEETESSTSSPTNSGDVLRWTGTATDSNGELWYLLICTTTSTPTANIGAPPTCGGTGTTTWAVSQATPSGFAATTSATTTKDTFPFQYEANYWYAFICDGNSSPQCNSEYRTGSGNTRSPFVINHDPYFVSVASSSSVLPGETITFSAVASDPDQIRGGDNVRLTICRTQSWTATTTCAGSAWATTTMNTLTNPATSTTIVIPTQDQFYNAYSYLYDDYNNSATSSYQGFNVGLTVRNATPTVAAATFSFSSSSWYLWRPNSTSGPFTTTFDVVDNNSCLNAAAGNEISSATTSIFRSGIGAGSCQTAANFNSNSCYTSAYYSQPTIVCTQNGGSCSGSSDTTSTWTCSFELWYNADPTDAATQYTAENWLSMVQVTDDNGALSPATTTLNAAELNSFLAFDVSQATIPYMGLQPGQRTDPLASTTDLLAYGNIGLDEDVYGSTMCTNWVALGGYSNPDACDAGGIDTSSEISAAFQRVATTSYAWTHPLVFTLAQSTTTTDVPVHVQKTIATSSPQTKLTYWGIEIPAAITLSGQYVGQNTIIGKKSSSAFW